MEDAYPRKRVYRVHTSFVSVEGQLTIGSSKQHFRNRIIFNLMPNRKARLPLLVKGAAYPDKANRRKLVTSIANVGHKAFAVVSRPVAPEPVELLPPLASSPLLLFASVY